MRRTGLLLLSFALASCERGPVPSMNAVKAASPAAVNPDAGVRTYLCEDGRTVEAGYPDRDTAVVDVGGHAHPLKAQVSADGVRYVGFGLQWWTKGLQEARLSRLKDGESIASDPGVICRARPRVPAAPPSPGASNESK